MERLELNLHSNILECKYFRESNKIQRKGIKIETYWNVNDNGGDVEIMQAILK